MNNLTINEQILLAKIGGHYKQYQPGYSCFYGIFHRVRNKKLHDFDGPIELPHQRLNLLFPRDFITEFNDFSVNKAGCRTLIEGFNFLNLDPLSEEMFINAMYRNLETLKSRKPHIPHRFCSELIHGISFNFVVLVPTNSSSTIVRKALKDFLAYLSFEKPRPYFSVSAFNNRFDTDDIISQISIFYGKYDYFTK